MSGSARAKARAAYYRAIRSGDSHEEAQQAAQRILGSVPIGRGPQESSADDPRRTQMSEGGR